MMKIRSGIKLNVCIFSILAFVFSSLFFQRAQAISEDVDASIVVHRDSMLSITLGGDIENGAASINITPYDSNGVFSETGDVTATVVSTNRNGYTLGMDSSTSALINTTNSSATIDELAAGDSGYPKADIPVNKWGYSLKTDEAYGNYFGLGDGVELQNVSGPTDGTISTLRFGAKVDASIPAGAYETTIVFTLTTKMESRRYMQDVASWGKTLAVNKSVIAYDSRDGKNYWVTKLETDPDIPDGRADCTGEGTSRICTQIWMTQNLDFDLDTEKTLTHADTDLGWGMTWTPQFDTTTDPNEFTNYDQNGKEDHSFDLGDDVYYYTSNSWDDDYTYTLAQCKAAGHSEGECKHYHSGNLYNYHASAALGAKLNEKSVGVSTKIYSEMPNSVCPAGWRLPNGITGLNGYSDYDYLLYRNSATAAHSGHENSSVQMYGDDNDNAGYATHLYGDSETATNGFNNMRTQPLWIVRAGIVVFGDLGVQGSYGRYWTSNIYSSGYPYYLYIDDEKNIFMGTLSVNFGHSVRCVARTVAAPEPQPTIMQDVTNATCPTTPTTVIDSRDGEEYTIQKLADNRCWMLENLRLDLTTTTNLTTANTNIMSNWTAPTDIVTWSDSYDIPKMGRGEDEHGIYYNYCAATAESYCYALKAGTGDATQDICPKGWRMPTGGSSGEYQALYAAYSSNYTDFMSSLRIPLSGIFEDGSVRGQGVNGSFWSSTYNDGSYMNGLTAGTTNVYPLNRIYRDYGGSVRCILK